MFDLKPELDDRHRAGLYRRRVTLNSAQGVHPFIQGKQVLSFSSNDYLGLANHADIKRAFINAVEHYGVGSGGAHLTTGHSQLHQDCEQALAAFTGRRRALLFSTGYMANLAIAGALTGRHDLIFQDKLNHASLIDAAKLCGAKLMRYRHQDINQLEQQLKQNQTQKRTLIMTDGVFSMDGDCADVTRISAIAARSDACCMVDDAHGFGVLGSNGGGLVQQCGLTQTQIPILMATLGKAIGTAGAFVAGSDALIETLIQRARPYIYTTALPPAIAAATLCSLQLVEHERWRREKLQELIDYLRRHLSRLDLDLMPSATAIQPLILGDSKLAMEFSEHLMRDGIHVSAIRPPTVAKSSARLRITLSAAHEKSDIDRLITSVTRIAGKIGPGRK